MAITVSAAEKDATLQKLAIEEKKQVLIDAILTNYADQIHALEKKRDDEITAVING